MSDRFYYEAGVGNELTSDNMSKMARDVLTVQTASATAATVQYFVVPRDCYIVGTYVTISDDPGANSAVCTLENAGGTVTYTSTTFANGASAGDSGFDATSSATAIPAGTVLRVQKDLSTAAVSATFTVVLATLDA